MLVGAISHQCLLECLPIMSLCVLYVFSENDDEHGETQEVVEDQLVRLVTREYLDMLRK